MQSPHPHLNKAGPPQCPLGQRPAGGGEERRDGDGQVDLKTGGEGQGPDGEATSGAGDEAAAELEVTTAASVFASGE